MVANVEDPVMLCAPDRRRAAAADRGEAGAAGGARRRQAAAAAVGDPGPRARGRRARHQDPVPGPVRAGEGPARVLPAPAAEGDPGRARRGRRGGRPRPRSCASSSRRCDLPEEVSKQVERELGRLERLQPAMAEYGVVRTYLEWIASLPWDTSTEDNLDLAHAREVLDADHYDIEKVKDRILEFLAVRSLIARRGPSAAGRLDPLFVGPPGVGKTSLGRSIARALGREFERISVGGVRDEAEIRGHRRTYIGAMPGVIVRALRDAGANNPLFMIDEIDKMGADFRGDPASGDARGARPRAERHLPRPLPRPPVRPLERDLHHHRQHPRHDPGAAARPDGDDPAGRLHRGREARRSPSATWCRARSSATG